MGPYDSYPTDPEATTTYYNPSKFRQSLSKPMGADGWTGVGTSFAGSTLGAVAMSKQRLNFSNIAPSQRGPFSAPVYTAGQQQNELSDAKARGASGGELANSALSGFTAGMATGNPLIAVGAALANTAATGIGGAVRKHRQQDEIDKQRGLVNTAQNTYNEEEEAYRKQQNQLYDYYNQNNAQGREYNIYKSRMIS